MGLDISTYRERTEQWVALDSGTQSEMVRVIVQSEAPGVVSHSGRPHPVVVLHAGRPIRMQCRHGAQCHVGLRIHGDIEVVPAETPARWETKELDTALALVVAPALLESVAQTMGCGAERLELRSRFQVRDPRLEHIAWALKAEVELGYPGSRLYLDSLATALAVQLVREHSSLSPGRELPRGSLPPRRLRLLLSYIEEHLHQPLRLPVLANVVGLSASHLKVLFRHSVGMPVHQYVIRRRVERAMLLLREGRTPISQVALEAGFAHQSHLAMHMRRLLGVSPRQFSALAGRSDGRLEDGRASAR